LELNLTEETLRFEDDPGRDTKSWFASAGHQHVRAVVSANNRRCEHQRCEWQTRGTPPRARHLGNGAADGASPRDAYGYPYGIDTARNDGPRTGHRVPEFGRAEYCGYQHHAFCDWKSRKTHTLSGIQSFHPI